MEKYFKKNMKFIVASLIFAVIAVICNIVNLVSIAKITNPDNIIDFVNLTEGDSIIFGSSMFLLLMIIIDIVFIIRKKTLARGTTLFFEAVMIIMMIFNLYETIGFASYGDIGSAFESVGPIMNLVIMFYWIQSFSYSDSVVKSKKDNDICYYLIIGLVLVEIVYYGFGFFFENIQCSEFLSGAELSYLISAISYIVITGIAYIFFAKAIENYQDELIIASEAKKEVRVEAGKKAAKTRKVNESKTTTKKNNTKKVSKK